MAELASMFVRVGANVDNFNRGMDQVQGRVNGFQRTMQGVGNAIGATLKVAGFAAAGATALLGAAVAKTGVEFNALKEQADIAFTTMLGSGEKAKSFLDELQRFAAKTPFEFPDLLMSSQRLLAMGFAAEEVMPTMTAIGDAVAALGGNAETINRVTTAFGQMNAKGKASAEEMMQLTEAGIPAWEFLAQKIGVDIPEAMKMVTKGVVSADTALAAVTEGINSRFGGMMEKQSATFNGLVSTLKDTFTMISGRVMAPFFKVMQKGLGWLVDFTSSPSFTAGIDKFVERITNGFALVGDAVKRFKNTFSLNLAVITSGNASWGEKLLAVWDMLYTVGMKIWQSLLDGLLKMVPEWLNNLWEWAKGLWQWIVEATPEAIAALWEWAKGLWGWLVENLPTWIDNLWEWAKATWQWIVDVTPEAVAKLGEWGLALWNWLTTNLPTWISTLGKWAVAAWQWIVDTTPIVVEKLGEWATALWQWLVDVTPTVVGKLADWGAALWEWLTTNLPIWVENLATWGAAAWEWIVEATQPAVDKLIEMRDALVLQLTTWASAMGPEVSLLWNAIQSIFRAGALLLQGEWAGAWNKIKEAAASVWLALELALQPLDAALRNFTNDFVTWKDVLVGAAATLAILFAPVIVKAIAAALAPLAGFVVAWAPVLALFVAATLAAAALRTAWETDWGGIKTNTLDALQVLKDAFGPLLTTIQQFGLDALGEIWDWVTGNETNFTAVKAIWESAKTAFGTVFDAIGAKLEEWGNAAWTWFSETFPQAADTLMAAVDSIKENWNALWLALEPLIEKIKQAWQDLVTNWGVESTNLTTATERMKGVLDGIITAIVTVVSGAMNGILIAMRLVVQLIDGDWAGAWESAKELAKNSINTAKNALTAAFSAILAAFGKNLGDVERWVGDVKRKFEELVRKFKEFGRDLVDGLKKGIEEKWNGFKNWLNGIWNQLTRTFTLKFDTKSPSGVFKDYGGDLMEGLAIGIKRGQNMVYGAMDSLDPGLMVSGMAGGAGTSSPAVSTSRIEELLLILIQELRAKNLSVNIAGGGSSGGLSELVQHNAGLRI